MVSLKCMCLHQLTCDGTNEKYRFFDLPSFSAFFVNQPLRTAPAPTVLILDQSFSVGKLIKSIFNEIKILQKSSYFINLSDNQVRAKPCYAVFLDLHAIKKGTGTWSTSVSTRLIVA